MPNLYVMSTHFGAEYPNVFFAFLFPFLELTTLRRASCVPAISREDTRNPDYNIDNITSYSMDYVGNENMKY